MERKKCSQYKSKNCVIFVQAVEITEMDVTSLPNFDKNIFKEITGIDVEGSRNERETSLGI